MSFIIPNKVSLLENNMLDFNDINDLKTAKSDHALLRVEFDDFVIYSYNLFNSDDESNIRSRLTKYSDDFKFSDSLVEQYKSRSKKRMQDIFTDIKTKYVVSESKKVIICLQELGSEMAMVAAEYFKDYMEYRSDPDLRSERDGLKLFNERRMILIPPGEYFRVRDSTSELPLQNIDFAFKNSIHVQIEIANRFTINLVNIQSHPLTNDDQLMELFDKVNSYDNLIIIGDFGRSLRRKNLMKYLIMNQLYFLAPDSATTIKQLPEGDEQDKSNIVDQVIFKVAKYITEEQRQRQILEDAKPKTFFENIFGTSTVNRSSIPIESPVSKEADETQNINTPLIESTPVMQGGVLYKIEYS